MQMPIFLQNQFLTIKNLIFSIKGKGLIISPYVCSGFLRYIVCLQLFFPPQSFLVLFFLCDS